MHRFCVFLKSCNFLFRFPQLYASFKEASKLLIEYVCLSPSFLPFARSAGHAAGHARLLEVGSRPALSLETSGLRLLPGVRLWQRWVFWVMSYFGFVCKMTLVLWTNKIWEKRQECMGNYWSDVLFYFFFSFPLMYFPISVWLAGSVILSEVVPLPGIDPRCRPPSVTAGGLRAAQPHIYTSPPVAYLTSHNC